MGTEALQFIFSLFSFIGVVGILFYLILAKVKYDEQQNSLEVLEAKVVKLQNIIEESLEKEDKVSDEENMKQRIIALHEEGKDIVAIEEALNIPRAKIEMVLKFHNLKKADNWRKSVN